MLGHMVYFKLRNNSSTAVQQLIAAAKQELTDHPGTVFFGVGTVVPDLVREVNVLDYDVALQLVFESRQAHDEYQQHERHLRFIAENRGNWAQVRVFDSDLTS